MKIHAFNKHAAILRTIIILVMILAAAVLRIAAHPWNFTPVGAMALFSGAALRDRRLAFLFPLLALFAGDLFIGFYHFRLLLCVYGSFLANVAIGRLLQDNRTVARIGGATFLGSLQFFAVTNFAVWVFLGSFPHSVAGLAACYASGLPFFWNTLAGDAFYVVLLFGGFALAERFVLSRAEPVSNLGSPT
jgi:uncharacterized protein DUF6580